MGPYEVVGPLARGGMASVLTVRDTRDGHLAAMKLLLPVAVDDDARKRFRREFRALSRLSHPNVLRVHEWGLRGDRPWYTMELVGGRNLREEVATWADLPPAERFARAERILVQIARALAYVHEQGLVHRDVTPGNVLVAPDGRAWLTDFGVVQDLGTDARVDGEVVGTVAYMSPEQIAGKDVDARADLYALGAVLYLMLTGRRPFHARTTQGYLDKHLHEQPRAPRELDPLVPPHLDEICRRLLSKDPRDRYASANHLLGVLGDTGGPLEADDRWPPRVVGRALAKARLREALEQLAAGRGGAAVLLTGGNGQGKSRLLDLAEAQAKALGLRVARGRCRPHDRPYGAFVRVHEALATPASPALLRAALAGELDGVVHERYPVNAAFRELVTEAAPCVVMLDDLESADPSTGELVDYLVRNTLELAHEHVVFLLGRDTPEDGEPPRAPHLDSPALQRIVLGPLQANEVEELVLSVLPNTPASRALARRLHRESDGSPAFLADMLRGLIDEGLIVREEHGHRLALEADEITRSRLPMPATLRQALRDRLAPLPGDALAVARLLAVARRRLDLDALVHAAPFDEDRVTEAIDALVDAGLADERRGGDVEQVELRQIRLRDVLLEDSTEAERRPLHLRLGEVLERLQRDRPRVTVEELAYHFEHAGVAPKAYAYLVLTAQRHQSASHFEEALEFLDRALGMEASARPFMLLDDADRRLAEVYLSRSQALEALGRWTEALADARRAESLARDVRDARLRSRSAAELGRQLRSQGLGDEAEPWLRRALREADAIGDASLQPMPLYQLGALYWSRGDLAEADRLWKTSLATAQRIGDERAQGDGFNGLGILAMCRGDAMEARRHLEQSARIFEHLGMLAPLAIVRLNLAELLLAMGLLRKALQIVEETVSKAREVQHPHGIALALTQRAHILLELGRASDALHSAEEALRLVRELGTVEDEVLVLGTLVKVLLRSGATEEAHERLHALLPLLAAHDAEGLSAQAHAWHAIAIARLGRNDEAIRLLDAHPAPERQWPHMRVRSDLARAIALEEVGRRDAAREQVQRALATAESCGFRYHQLLAHHALCRLVDDESAHARHVRVASALSRSLAANLPADDARRFLDRGWGGD